ncbi:MAG TPA: hypothetical protein VL172_19800 [Kofleriaceae bacterium]|nr:hypothetical protein [Kofleriaceae bacterium]
MRRLRCVVIFALACAGCSGGDQRAAGAGTSPGPTPAAAGAGPTPSGQSAAGACPAEASHDDCVWADDQAACDAQADAYDRCLADPACKKRCFDSPELEGLRDSVRKNAPGILDAGTSP